MLPRYTFHTERGGRALRSGEISLMLYYQDHWFVYMLIDLVWPQWAEMEFEDAEAMAWVESGSR